MPRKSSSRVTCALTIAGSDSGGGAGIQADLKTFAAHGLHGLSAIAALTAQNTRAVTAVQVPPPTFLRAQVDACFDDFAIGAVKIGMLANARVIHAVADALADWRPRRIVLDPVMVASSGARLLQPVAGPVNESRLRHGYASPMPFEPVFDYSYDAVMRSWRESRLRLPRPRAPQVRPPMHLYVSA